MPFPVPDFHLLYVDVPTEKWGGGGCVLFSARGYIWKHVSYVGCFVLCKQRFCLVTVHKYSHLFTV